MNNTNQQLYVIYNNIHKFYEYRKLYPLDAVLDQDKFIKTIQKDKFIVLSSIPLVDVQNADGEIDKQKVANAKDMKLLVILLIYPGTECENKSANMEKIIGKIPHQFADVIVVTIVKLSTGVAKKLNSLKSNTKKLYRTYKAFTYPLFATIIPDYDLAPVYKILSKEETDELVNNNTNLDALPKIFEHDPQMIWLGAKIGDVVILLNPSETTCKVIGYRKVIPNL